ncbi:MAG: thioredoxin domain-containing protein [Planctomycetota bacterium]|nr:thioredoxin domain-containing protein [Planctomycetota bacterium]
MSFQRTTSWSFSMNNRLLPFLLLFTVALGNVQAEAPFLDMTYQEAIQKAGEEKKQVFIDFYTTWCGPCKMLDRTTWKDKKVQNWLHEHTIPLKIDAEKQKDLAKKFKIQGYPSMVFIHPDGKVGGRIVGYRDAGTFLRQAEDALHGMTPLKRAKQAFEADPDSTRTRYDLGQALAAEGKYKEALEQFEWCWTNGADAPGFGGVRGSFLLMNIQRLSRHYPPAKQRLEEWMNQAHERLINKEALKHDPGDYAGLHSRLGLPAQERLATYDQLVDSGNNSDAMSLSFYMTDDFYEAERFDVLGKTINVDSQVFTINHMADYLKTIKNDQQRSEMLKLEIESHARNIEVLLILDRSEEANQLLGIIEVLKPDAGNVQVILDSVQAARKRGVKNTPTDEDIRARFLATEPAG